MIPVTQAREVIAGGVRASSSFDISGENVAHILTILRDTLYSDKIMAVLREYSSNSWDEHRKCGKADVPIEVHLPTMSDPVLRIRDHGPGLSPDDVERIFTKYGASTKRDDNIAVGMLGIGSKSGFAYSDSFTVTSWHDGVRREYVAVIDDSQKGKMDLLHEEILGAGVTASGVEISLAVRPQDIREFEVRAQRLYPHFVPQPKINVALTSGPSGRRVVLDGRTLGAVSEDNNDWSNKGKWTAVMGCVPYRIDLAQLGKVVAAGEHHSVSGSASNISGTVYFDIGELQVAASREELKYGDATRLAIIRRINDLIDEFVRQMLSGIEFLSQWERRLRIRTVDGLGLPVPRDHLDMKSSWVELKTTAATVPGPNGIPQSRGIVRLTNRNYNGTQTENKSVRIERGARIVLKDDKRTVKGFSLTERDMLVSPEGGLSMSSMVVEVNRMVKAAMIEGIPIVKLSSVTWTAPPRSAPNGLTRDPAKARAQMLVLDAKTVDFGATPLSRHWAVVVRAATDKDVWVVLESYRVSASGMPQGDFYEQWLTDNRMLKELGLELPPIIGYRDTEARPVTRSKLKGTDYVAWRARGMIELLKTHPGMKSLIEAMENGGEASYDMDVGLLTARLGADHVLTRLGLQVNDARKVVTAADRKLIGAARQVRGAASLVDTTVGLRKEISERYPLVRVTGEGAFGTYGGHKELWVDYVTMVDAMEQLTRPEQQKEERKSA